MLCCAGDTIDGYERGLGTGWSRAGNRAGSCGTALFGTGDASALLLRLLPSRKLAYTKLSSCIVIGLQNIELATLLLHSGCLGKHTAANIAGL